jgi:nucleoside-diphosphate-sugar epimerase
MEKMLVIGSAGQIGSELVMALRERYGASNVIAGVNRTPAPKDVMESGPSERVDVMSKQNLGEIVDKYGITHIYHLAAVLSAICESKPLEAWQINMDSLFNILELAREKHLKQIFWPSSIGAFGPTTPRFDTPQVTIMEPNTVYGISKLAGERWVEYYWNKYKVDTRGLRYPGLISYKTEPGGGTTDYAVAIFYEALKAKKYECFLGPDTLLPMMYMPDALKATIDLMEAPAEKISIRSNYNVGAITLDPKSLAVKIKKHIPEFEITYKPDFRQKIADSWPASIDDSVASKDWGWKPAYNLDMMVEIMLKEVAKKLNITF